MRLIAALGLGLALGCSEPAPRPDGAVLALDTPIAVPAPIRQDTARQRLNAQSANIASAV